MANALEQSSPPGKTVVGAQSNWIVLHLAHGQSGETWLAFFDSQRGLNFDEEKRCARLFSNVLQHEGLKYMGVIQTK